ncbi:MAG TPA: hypothetical protein VG796_16195 [Verrucomicrobiales bacterium]|nr:hypothetical protein [Verrucomicrobiales bacterium]
MKILSCISWALNVVLAVVYFRSGSHAEPSSAAETSVRKGTVSQPATATGPSLKKGPAAASAKTADTPETFRSDLLVGKDVTLPRSLALHFRYIGRGSVLHCATALLLPGNRADALTALNLYPSDHEVVLSAITEASEGLLKALLKGAKLEPEGTDGYRVEVQFKPDDFKALRSQFESRLDGLPDDVREAAMLLAFDGATIEGAAVPLTLSFNLAQSTLTIATDPKSQILLSGGQVTQAPVWKRLVQDVK